MTISKNESRLFDRDFERRINLDFIAKNGGDFLLTVCIEREGSLISPVFECAACLQVTERAVLTAGLPL
jgi:hypothetical protein